MSDIDGGLRKIFRTHMPDIMWTSIESGSTGSGISDSNFLMKGGTEGWIEYKVTDGWAVTLKPEQIGWIERRVRYGGRVLIAVRRRTKGGPRSPAADELWVMPGGLARQARLGGLRDPAVARVARCLGIGGPARWDWAAARFAIGGPMGLWRAS